MTTLPHLRKIGKCVTNIAHNLWYIWTVHTSLWYGSVCRFQGVCGEHTLPYGMEVCKPLVDACFWHTLPGFGGVTGSVRL